MADIYIDISAALDGDGGAANPRNVVPTITAGNRYLFRGGVVVPQSVTVSAAGVTICSYGEGRAIIDLSDAADYGVYSDSGDNILVQDLVIRRARKNGIAIENNAVGTTRTGVVIRGCKVSGVLPGSLSRTNEQNIRVGTGIMVGSGPTAGTAVISDVLIEDCEVFDCGAHGIDVRWRVMNVTRRRCHVYRVGLQIGSHGITSHPIVSTITSGWALVSGTVYSRARVSTNDVEQFMANMSDNTSLVKTTGTSPGVGQWSVSGSSLYVNIGGPVTGKSFVLKRHAHGPFYDEEHVVHDVVDYDGVEGHGIGTDDCSGPCTIVRCLSYNNEGGGYYSFRGESITRRDCVAKENGKYGFGSLLIDTGKDHNCIAVSNAQRGFQYIGGRSSEAINCLAVGNDTEAVVGSASGFFAGGTAIGFSSASNVVYQNGAGGSQVSGVGLSALSIDPLLDTNYRPLPGSPLIGAGTHLGYRRDFDGKQRQNPPSIGAFDVARVKPA